METTEIRKLMAVAMSDKTFTIIYARFSDYNGEREVSKYTGTLELEGSFAVIREWETVRQTTTSGDSISDGKVLVAIHVIPANQIISIDWINPHVAGRVVKMSDHVPARA